MNIPSLDAPAKRTPTVIRLVFEDWPHCPDHEESLLVRRHPHSLFLWCDGGHHFLPESRGVMKKVWAYEVEGYPNGRD
jgi:hypothetical protein